MTGYRRDLSLEKERAVTQQKKGFVFIDTKREKELQRITENFSGREYYRLPLTALGRWVVKCSDSYKFKSYLLLTQNVFISLRHINPRVNTWGKKKGKAAGVEAGTHRCHFSPCLFLVTDAEREPSSHTPAKTMVVHRCQTLKRGLQPFTYPMETAVQLCLLYRWRN